MRDDEEYRDNLKTIKRRDNLKTSKYLSMLKTILQEPFALKEHCRLHIRRYLGERCNPSLVSCLEIPVSMQQYLNLVDFV